MRFCIVMKSYITLFYKIKHGDIDFLYHVIQNLR